MKKEVSSIVVCLDVPLKCVSFWLQLVRRCPTWPCRASAGTTPSTTRSMGTNELISSQVYSTEAVVMTEFSAAHYSLQN